MKKRENKLTNAQTTLHWHALFGPVMVTHVVGRWLLLVVVMCGGGVVVV